MTAELKLPKRDVLCRHVIDSLRAYWPQNTDLLSKIPIHSQQENLNISLPLKMVAIDLPEWGNECGVDGQMLVPQECLNQQKGKNIWEQVDWWLAMFLLLEGWHERHWEQKYGTIHSYSFRLKGWDSRVWEHAWVNRMALFLCKWCLEIGLCQSLGEKPKYRFLLTHDVDAVRKTLSIRLKQTAFNFYNFFRNLLRGKFANSWKSLCKGFSMFLRNEDWWVFDKLLKLESESKLSSIFHFHADYGKPTLKKWLMDPCYDVSSERLKNLFHDIHKKGHVVGLHPSYDSWNKSEVLEKQKKFLSNCLGSQVRVCRQHWLRFSWEKTWEAQSLALFEQDYTLMFNDRPGFRNAAVVNWKPWNPKECRAHYIQCNPTFFMDSHLYDYMSLNEDERAEEIKKWILECEKVHGEGVVLWHPHTLSRSYGWQSGFEEVVRQISKGHDVSQ